MTLPSCACAILALLVFASCESTEKPGSADRGVSAVQFQDVVVPDGMALVDRYHESHSREEAGWRFGHFEYVGSPRVEDACSHVLLRMPQHHWRLTSDEAPDAQTRNLRFERGRYTTKYALQRIDGITHMVIEYRTEVPSR